MVLRAGIIGCGRIGSEFDSDPKRKVISSHAGAYENNPKTELVAVSDVNVGKLEDCRKRWNVPNAYADYKEMLRKEKLDILSICTWSSTHHEIVNEAAKYGLKAIFCEKPMSDTLGNAREMVEVCNNNGVLLAVDHQRRYDIFHQRVKEMFTGGKIGEIQQATFYYTAGIANTGTHVLDLLRFYLGDVEWVQANLSKTPSPGPEDPNIDALIRFKNGANAAIQACDVKRYLIFELSLLGTKGKVVINRSGFDAEYYETGESTLFSGYNELYKKEFPFEKDTPREFMRQALQHIVECIEQKKQPVCSGEDGAAAVELICALHESAKKGGARINLPLESSDFIIKSK